MSLTRRALKAMGIEDEKIDEIINMHTETVEGLKAEAAKYKAGAEALPDIQKQLERAQADLQEEFDGYKKEQAQKEARSAKEKAYRELLQKAGISDRRIDAVLRVSDIDGVELDENGAVKGADKLLEGIKSEWSDFITTTETRGAQTSTPPANHNSGTLTKADIYKKDEHGRYVMSASERQKALMENQIV